MMITLPPVLNIISHPLLSLRNKENGLDLNYTWNNKDEDSWHFICISCMLCDRCFINAIHVIEKDSVVLALSACLYR